MWYGTSMGILNLTVASEMICFLETYQRILSCVTEWNTGEILSETDRQKASRYVRSEDRDRFVAARLLFYAYLKHKFPSFMSLKNMTYDRYGKPVLNIEGISFNWSHSGDLIALIVGKSVCGIDVELHSSRPLFDYKSICTEREWRWIEAGDEVDRFYKIWTAKESVLKATGFGLSINPVEIEIVYQNSQDYIGSLSDGQKFFGCSNRIKEGIANYSWSFCTDFKTDVTLQNVDILLN